MDISMHKKEKGIAVWKRIIKTDLKYSCNSDLLEDHVCNETYDDFDGIETEGHRFPRFEPFRLGIKSGVYIEVVQKNGRSENC
jgi:hypothetical protein